jgi:WD40 repeat protein
MASSSSPPECKYLSNIIYDVNDRLICALGVYDSLTRTLLVAGSSDKAVRFIDPRSGRLARLAAGHRRTIMAVSVSNMGPNGEDPITVTGGKDGGIIIWSPNKSFLGESLQMPVEEIRCMSIYQGSESYLLVGSKESKIVLWDLSTDTVVAFFQGHNGSVHCVSIVAVEHDENESDLDHLVIASGGADRTARTWDLKTGKRKLKLKHKKSVGSIVVANKSKQPLLATGIGCDEINIWDVESGLNIRVITASGPTQCLVFWERFEFLLITASADKAIRIYDVFTEECVCTLWGHVEEIRNIAIVPGDNPLLASGSIDRTIRIWNLDQIIKDFYRGSDDSTKGERNDKPPYSLSKESINLLLDEEQKKLEDKFKTGSTPSNYVRRGGVVIGITNQARSEPQIKKIEVNEEESQTVGMKTIAEDLLASIEQEDEVRTSTEPSMPTISENDEDSVPIKNDPKARRRSSLKFTVQQNTSSVIEEFTLASTQKSLDEESDKQKRQDKLRERLNKRQGVSEGTEGTSSSKTSNEAQEERMKALLLKQHKLQEENAKASITAAKAKSNAILKKRLEEAKKKLEEQKAAGEIESDSSDSDSDDDDDIQDEIIGSSSRKLSMRRRSSVNIVDMQFTARRNSSLGAGQRGSGLGSGLGITPEQLIQLQLGATKNADKNTSSNTSKDNTTTTTTTTKAASSPMVASTYNNDIYFLSDDSEEYSEEDGDEEEDDDDDNNDD